MAIASRRIGKYKCVTWDDISEGVRLIVHTKEWFEKNCTLDNDGDYEIMVTRKDGRMMSVYFTFGMVDKCDKMVTVASIKEVCIRIDGFDDQFAWYPEMFECVVN